MANYIGIDLGTTFSAVATIDESGKPVIVPNDSFKEAPTGDITASCIMQAGKKIIIGDQARNALQLNEKAIGRFKRDMGTKKEYQLGDKSCTPQDLSSMMLRKLKEIALKKLGDVSKATVTIPANFSNEARAATMSAALEAGLDIDHIINEPTAAALYFAYTNDVATGKYAIFDLGGGTFDLSIIEIKGTDVDVITSSGINRCGGDDFDAAIVKLAQEKMKSEENVEITEQDFTLKDAEDCKISLSKKTKNAVMIQDIALQISRKEFEESISILLSQMELACKGALEDAKINTDELRDVILVGGSTRMPCIASLVEKVFKKSPVIIDKTDEAVALGAALYAAYKSDGKDLSTLQKDSINNINITECANHHFGYTAADIQKQKLFNDILIEKNTKLPTSVTREYVTLKDGQTKISIEVNQSDEATDDVELVKTIYKGELTLPPDRPAGQKVNVTFTYNDSEMMSIKVHDVSSGAEVVKELSMSDDDDEDILIE